MARMFFSALFHRSFNVMNFSIALCRTREIIFTIEEKTFWEIYTTRASIELRLIIRAEFPPPTNPRSLAKRETVL